jgi:hypothetical protein
MRAFHAHGDAGLDGGEKRSLIGNSDANCRLRFDRNWASKLDQGNARGAREFFAALLHLF